MVFHLYNIGPFVDEGSASCYILFQELFYVAISRYIEQPEKKDLLLHLLQWMPGQGYPVDSSTRSLILKNSALFGCHSITEVLSKHYAVKTK